MNEPVRLTNDPTPRTRRVRQLAFSFLTDINLMKIAVPQRAQFVGAQEWGNTGSPVMWWLGDFEKSDEYRYVLYVMEGTEIPLVWDMKDDAGTHVSLVDLMPLATITVQAPDRFPPVKVWHMFEAVGSSIHYGAPDYTTSFSRQLASEE